jgi:hypothetical protein
MMTGQWTFIKDALEVCFTNAKRNARTMMDIYLAGKEKNDQAWVRQEIEHKLLGNIKGLGHFKKNR